jgi:hypothetical protein
MNSLLARLEKLEEAVRQRASQRGLLFQVKGDPRTWDCERREFPTLADAQKANPDVGDVWTVVDFSTVDLMLQIVKGEGRDAQLQAGGEETI